MNEDIPDHVKLQQPARHNLPELLRALKWGRTGSQQDFLLKLANAIEGGSLDGTLKDLLDDPDNIDPADWWKH